ncbi:MAG: response regulator [Candidatus Helarchaeota archaeon]
MNKQIPMIEKALKQVPDDKKIGKRILLVDDDQSFLKSLHEILKLEGFIIDVAMNGIEALNKISKEDYDLILSDIRMPAMDGVELCRECKSHSNLKNIPFIMYSGVIDDIDTCADNFLPKPIESKELLNIIRTHLI